MRPPSEAGSSLAVSLAVLVAAAGSAGCRDGVGSGSDGGAAAVTEASVGFAPRSPAPSATAAPLASVANAHPTWPLPSDGGPLAICRVMASEGGPPASADATTWLDVPARANFTVRTLESGRELRFEGAGRVRACGSDVALVAAGSALGLPGSGEAPGAEQWVATACGAARWASGVHRFGATRDACTLQSSLGSAQLWLADDVTAEEAPLDAGAPDASAPGTPSAAPSALAAPSDAGHDAAGSPWRRIDAKRALRLRPRGPLDGPAALKSALVACEGAAAEVEGLARRMLGGDAALGDVGELAARSVVARGSARAACAVAAVRLSLSGPKPADQARLDAADSRWRAPQAR